VILLAGLALGLPCALLGARALQSLLFGLTPGDAPTLLGMVALLLVTGIAAAWIPARRAVKVDPATVLRYE
jgi:putative ABC transport system permease protein